MRFLSYYGLQKPVLLLQVVLWQSSLGYPATKEGKHCERAILMASKVWLVFPYHFSISQSSGPTFLHWHKNSGLDLRAGLILECNWCCLRGGSRRGHCITASGCHRAAAEAIASLHLDATESSCCQQLPLEPGGLGWSYKWCWYQHVLAAEAPAPECHLLWSRPGFLWGHSQQDPRCSEQQLSATVTHSQLSPWHSWLLSSPNPSPAIPTGPLQ